VLEIAAALGLDMERFRRDLDSDEARRRVDEDLAEGRRNGVTGTPTLFVDGIRYDGAWDFYSMLEALERPVGTLVKRSARVFASLPASGGLVLILAARRGAALRQHGTGALLPAAHRILVQHRPAGRAADLDRGRLVLRGAAGILLPAGRARDPPRDDGGRSRRLAGGAVARHCRRGRLPGAGGNLSGAEHRADRARLVGADGDGHRLRARHPRRCWASAFPWGCGCSWRRSRWSTTSCRC
jgi:hypothetical protein